MAKLSDILDGMEMQHDELRVYFDRQSGRVEMVSEEDRMAAEYAEDGEQPPVWQEHTIELYRTVAADTGGRFVPLPDRFEIHEWDMMRRFAQAVSDPDAAEALMNAIHGKGAFR